MGVSGFLSHHFARSNVNEINRCIYGNEFDDICQGVPFNDIKVTKFSSICRQNWECPGNNTEATCEDIFRAYNEKRLDFEQNYLNKPQKQDNSGQFHLSSYLGYCEGEGNENYLSIVGN